MMREMQSLFTTHPKPARSPNQPEHVLNKEESQLPVFLYPLTRCSPVQKGK
ncbi:ras-specific guanine nucleotide-releasing factor 1, partial [Clarias magur]